MTREAMLQKHAYEARQTYHWYKEHGICVKCHSADAKPGGVHCEDCTMWFREWFRQKRLKNIEAGLCAECGKNRPREGYKLCDKCRMDRHKRGKRT